MGGLSLSLLRERAKKRREGRRPVERQTNPSLGECVCMLKLLFSLFYIFLFLLSFGFLFLGEFGFFGIL